MHCKFNPKTIKINQIMKQKTTLFILAYLLSIPMMYGQFVVKPTYFEATGVSNQGNVVGYEAQAVPSG